LEVSSTSEVSGTSLLPRGHGLHRLLHGVV
jgi:hypothetical protein